MQSVVSARDGFLSEVSSRSIYEPGYSKTHNVQSDQSLTGTLWVAKDPKFHVDIKDRSNCASIWPSSHAKAEMASHISLIGI